MTTVFHSKLLRQLKKGIKMKKKSRFSLRRMLVILLTDSVAIIALCIFCRMSEWIYLYGFSGKWVRVDALVKAFEGIVCRGVFLFAVFFVGTAFFLFYINHFRDLFK